MLGLGGVLPSVWADGSVRTVESPAGLLIYREVAHHESVEDEVPILVLGLHGFGIDERQVATLVALELERPFVYLALRGFYTLEDGTYGWFPIHFVDSGKGALFPEIRSDDLADCTQRLAEAVEILAREAGVEPGRVVLVGYSQGAVTALASAIRYPHLFQGVAALAGSLPREALEASKGVEGDLSDLPIFLGHGTKDPLIPAPELHWTRDTLEHLGAAVTDREYPIPHVVSAAGRRDLASWIDQLSTDSSSRR